MVVSQKKEHAPKAKRKKLRTLHAVAIQVATVSSLTACGSVITRVKYLVALISKKKLSDSVSRAR